MTPSSGDTAPPLRVLHLITSLDRGGAQSMLAKLVAHMDRRRFTSTVVSLVAGGGHAAELAAAGFTVHALDVPLSRPTLGGWRRLQRIIAAERPQLLQSWLYHADLLGLVAAIRHPGMRLAWNLRGSNVNLRRSGLHVRAVRRMLALASRFPDAVLVNSAAGQRFHAGLGYRPKRWELVPNGFDAAVFHPDAAARARWRGEFGLGEDRLLFGMVARVHPMKDHANFFAAAERIAAARPDVSFLLVGADTEHLAPPEALRGRIHALGERAAVADLLPALDLMLLSSRWGEGFPNVIGEAMACAVPCVATDVGESAAVIGETGLIVPPQDPAALAAAALRLAEGGREALDRRGALALRRIEQHYSIAAIARRYGEIYEELIAASPRR